MHPTVDEPRIALPTARLVATALVVAGAFLAIWAAIGAAADLGPGFLRAGVAAVIVTTAFGVLSDLVTLPWIEKPASTALLAWMAGSILRMLGTLAVALLLYSAPLTGPLGGLAGARTAFLLAIAVMFLVGLLAEVAVVANSVLRPPSPAGE